MLKNDFFTGYKSKIAEIETTYPKPNPKYFQQRKFSKLKWNAKTRNFYTILKVLSEHGPCTITKIVENDGLNQSFDKQLARRNIYNRIINGNESLGIDGLIERGFVEIVKNSKSKIKKYGLTLHGVIFSLSCFNPLDDDVFSNYTLLASSNSDYNLSDFSFQKDFNDFFVDVIAKNYPHVLPKIFGKWDYFKSHPKIDVYRIFGLIDGLYFRMQARLPDLVRHNKYGETLSNPSDYITMLFYCFQIGNKGYSFKEFHDSLDDDGKHYVTMFFHSYIRASKEQYYRALIYERVAAPLKDSPKNHSTEHSAAIRDHMKEFNRTNDLSSDRQRNDLSELVDTKRIFQSLLYS